MPVDLPSGSSVRVDGPTPNGGAYSISYYKDASGEPVPEAKATSAEIVEFTASGSAIHRTYTRLGVGQ